MKKITLFIVLNLLSLISFGQFKKELVYTSELNTNLKEWVDEYSKLKTQIQEVANLQQRIDSNNSKMVVYESDCAKSNGFNCNYYSIKQYNAYRERDLYQITDKSFIIKILKELNLNKKSIDLTSSYLVKGDNAGIESVYLKTNINGIWMCMEFLNSDQKESLMTLLLKNDILSMTEESKVNALKTLTGLDDKYFNYLIENYEYTEKIKTFNKTQTSIENSKYKYIGSFNTNGTKKWGILFDGDNDTLFIGKWFNNFPDLENGKSFLYNNTENVVILEENGLVFKSYIGGKFYVGSMKDNVANGLGFVLFNNGDRYIGSFLNGRYNGNGILYKNGDRYNGNFLDGKKSGQGFISFEYGGWYDGEWKNDMYDGLGELGSSDGQKSIGLFSQNVFVKSKADIEQEKINEQNKIAQERIEEQNRIEQERIAEENSKKQEKEKLAQMEKIANSELDACVFCNKKLITPKNRKCSYPPCGKVFNGWGFYIDIMHTIDSVEEEHTKYTSFVAISCQPWLNIHNYKNYNYEHEIICCSKYCAGMLLKCGPNCY
jgi:hypothetical protein